jgi:hypothetical protein
LQKKYAHEFRAQHLPIVTVMAARGSIVYDYTINYPDSISIPHTAFPEPPPETNKPPVQAIVAVPTNDVPVAPAPPPRHIEIIMAGTNHLAHELSRAELAALTAPPASSNSVSVTAQQSQPPPADSTPAPAPVPGDSQQAALTVPPVVAQSAPAPVPVTPPAPPIAAGAIASTSSTSPLPLSQPKSTEATSHTSASAPIPTTAAAPVREARPALPPSPAAPVLETDTVTASPAGRQVALSIIAISLLTIAVVLVIFLVRHLRGDASPSLISQSMDRGR